jgi:hypothetical protein
VPRAILFIATFSLDFLSFEIVTSDVNDVRKEESLKVNAAYVDSR